MVLHFLLDHFVYGLSNFYSSQHSTEAFKRSFVHSCITKLNSKFIFGFKLTRERRKKKKVKIGIPHLELVLQILDLVT